MLGFPESLFADQFHKLSGGFLRDMQFSHGTFVNPRQLAYLPFLYINNYSIYTKNSQGKRMHEKGPHGFTEGAFSFTFYLPKRASAVSP